MQTNEKNTPDYKRELEKNVWLFWKGVLCRAVIFISIRLLFMATTFSWKQILVKVSIIFPESSHTLFYSIGCISIIYRESSNVLFSSNVYHSNAFGIPYKLRTEERQNLDSLTLTGSWQLVNFARRTTPWLHSCTWWLLSWQEPRMHWCNVSKSKRWGQRLWFHVNHLLQ